jgi:dipeptidyl-peptidase-4
MPIQTLSGHVLAAVTIALLGSNAVAAQQKALTLDDIYDPTTRVSFSGSPVTNLSWIDRTRYAWPRSTAGGTEWMSVDAISGSVRPLFDTARMQSVLEKLPGVSQSEASGLARSRSLVFNRTYSAVLFEIQADLYVYAFDTDRAVRLTYTRGAEELASFSPDEARVAFVRENNLHVVEIASQRETALTSEGATKILNGRLDWVYEEEIYGRGERQAYWWSPDSSRIAFLRIDDNPVPTYLTIDDIPYDQNVEQWDYPKAGDPNPGVTLGVARVNGGPLHWVDIARYSEADRLISGVAWTPDGRVVFEVQNRIQTWLDLNVADLTDGETRTLLRETSKAWVDPPEGAHPIWLKDGSFLWLSERSGWKHLYHYRPDGTLIRQITSGVWETRAVHGIDEATGWIYFSGTERSYIGSDVYRIRLDGAGMERLSQAEGTHTARFAPEFDYYIDSWSNVATPTQVRLHRNNGSEVRVIDANRVAALSEYRMSIPEFMQVTTRDGFVMEAMMIKPRDFDPSRRYPVYQWTYGGPRAPRVRNAWGGSEYMYHQLLAQKGIIVWVCDNRTASGKGAQSAWPVYRNFGELELRDIEDGVAWLKRQPYVDGSRIGIHGWSYGGYLTSYALTHSTSFTMGIAGGTVSDWRDYDTMYTERYMGLPQDNPDGYRRSSPRWAAKNLRGALLLIHGMVDDNVHVSNTTQFAYELQRAQKPFRMMLYAKSRHAITDPALVKHLRATMLDFIVEHLKPTSASTPTTSSPG